MSTKNMSTANVSKNLDLNKKKQKKMWHPFLALIIMIIVVAVASYVIPAGEFDRFQDEVTGRTLVDPTSYHEVESNPTSIGDFFRSFYFGFNRVSGIIVLVLFVGGAFNVVKAMGLMDLAVQSISEKFGKKGLMVIAPVVMLIIFGITSLSGWRELDIIFISMVIPICLTLGYDSMTALGMVLIASCSGFAAAMSNPYFTGIAHTIAELPIYSAMWYRGMMGGIFLLTGFAYLLRYASKIKKDPSKGLMYGTPNEQHNRELYIENAVDKSDFDFSPRLKLAGLLFIGLFVFMIFGTLKLGFGFADISACFAAMAIVPGLVGGLGPNGICEHFADGCKELLTTALIMLFARSILVIMEDARIIDTVIFNMSNLIVGTSASVSSIMIFLFQTVINFIIPSGSGQAVVTMPIITPLSDIAEVNRQVACLASQLGDGLTNYIYPTNGILMGVMAVSNIPYSKWARFFLPLFAFYTVVSAILIAVAQAINLGPF